MKPNKQTTIATLLQQRCSQREIERVTGIDRKTIRSYQRRFEAESANSPGLATGAEAAAQAAGAQIPPPRPPAPALSGTSACEPWREFIEAQARLKRNAMAVYQDLVDHHGFGHRYNSVKRFMARLRQRDPEQFDRLEFGPGEEAQVDYGEGALTFDVITQRWRRPRLFVMTLRYSRRCFRRVVWKSSQQTWAELHEQAFRYFGGATRYVVLDNLKEGVIKPDLYEPELNPVYAAMLAHYGSVADPARVRDPNRKGAVESAIQHTQATALKGRRFDSLQAQNDFLEDWELRWAAPRIHGREKRQVQAMFEEERAALTTLPALRFSSFRDLVRTVCDDTTVRVDNSNYAARPAAIGQKVLVRLYDHLVEIRDRSTQALLRTHARSNRPGSVILPDEERPFNPSRQTGQLFARAARIGPSCLQVCRDWFAREGRVGQRRMWGLVGLAEKYPSVLVERACKDGCDQGLCTLKTLGLAVRALAAEAALDGPHSEPAGPAGPALTQQHALIRGAEDYAEFFAQATRAEHEVLQ